jgi:gluconolactonase
VRVFDVSADNQLSHSRVFCQIDKGVPDGMRCDRHGNLLSTSEDSIQIFNPAGELLGKIPVPETPANLCFGGPGWNDLYITARKSLYHVKLTTAPAGK